MKPQICICPSGVGFIIEYRWSDSLWNLPGSGWGRVRHGPADMILWRRFRVQIGSYDGGAQ